MVEKQELPLHAVFRGELVAGRVDDAHLAYELRRLDAACAHEDQLLVHLCVRVQLEDARKRLTATVLAVGARAAPWGVRIVTCNNELS